MRALTDTAWLDRGSSFWPSDWDLRDGCVCSAQLCEFEHRSDHHHAAGSCLFPRVGFCGPRDRPHLPLGPDHSALRGSLAKGESPLKVSPHSIPAEKLARY